MKSGKKLDTTKIWGCSKSYFWIGLVQVSQISWKAIWIVFNKNISYLPQDFPYTNKTKDLKQTDENEKLRDHFVPQPCPEASLELAIVFYFLAFKKPKDCLQSEAVGSHMGGSGSRVLLNTEWDCLVLIHCQQCGLGDQPNENMFTASPYWCSTVISA